MALLPHTTFGWWLHSFRGVGENERDFATRLGIDQRTLRRIYEGKPVHQRTYNAIATALKVMPGDVFNRASTSQPDEGTGRVGNLISMIVDRVQGLPEVDLIDILKYITDLLSKRASD